MASKGHFIIACIITSIAVLYQIECNPHRWKAADMANIGASPEQLARFLTNTDMVNKWFSWLSLFKEADGRPIGQGKKYQAFYKIPILGDYSMLFSLTEYKPNEWYVLESDSLLKPRFTIHIEATNEKISKVDFSLEFRRLSALYHFTFGPIFWFLSQQQLRHALFSLKMFFPF